MGRPWAKLAEDFRRQSSAIDVDYSAFVRWIGNLDIADSLQKIDKGISHGDFLELYDRLYAMFYEAYEGYAPDEIRSDSKRNLAGHREISR